MVGRIVINKEILNGKPIIKGTRISVEFILELLSSGMSIKEVLEEYPQLKDADILEALDYASRALKHEEVYPLPRIRRR